MVLGVSCFQTVDNVARTIFVATNDHDWILLIFIDEQTIYSQLIKIYNHINMYLDINAEFWKIPT